MARRLSREERSEEIVRRVQEEGFISVADLSRDLGVSAVTVRGDLDDLQRAGRLIRTHGGALPASPSESALSFSVRMRLNAAQKDRIGAAAAATVSDGEAVILDASTTCLFIACHLLGRHDLTVLTTGLHVGLELLRSPGITVLMPGGRLWHEAASVVGDLDARVLDEGHYQRGFFGGRGLTVEHGLTDAHLPEVEIKRRLVKAVREVNVVLDGSKVGKVAFANCAAVGEIDRLFTTRDAQADVLDDLRAAGVEVVVS